MLLIYLLIDFKLQKGFFSLYRGLAPTLVGSIPKAGIRFGLRNSVIKDNLRDKYGKLTLGRVSGFSAQLVLKTANINA